MATHVKFTCPLMVVLLLNPTSGIFVSSKFNRGTQKFDFNENGSDVGIINSQNFEFIKKAKQVALPTFATTAATTTSSTTEKPHPTSYRVVNWRRYYPFGEKFLIPDSNRTGSNQGNDTSADPIVYSVLVKVPIRVPVKPKKKPMYRQKFDVVPHAVVPMRVGGTRFPFKFRPNGMVRYMRRFSIPQHRFNTYHTTLIPRRVKYVKPRYLKTGVHDFYQTNMYFPLQSLGYKVREPEADEHQGSMSWSQPKYSSYNSRVIG